MGMRSQRGTRRRSGSVVLALLCAATLLGAVNVADAGGRLREKDLNLDIAKRVQARLAAAGVIVYMTRTTDKTLSLSSRTAFANARRVDAFISIHNNGSRNRAARGTEVYRSIRGGGSKRLGDALRARLARSPGLPTSIHARRGDHGDYYYVLRNTRMPAVIVEGAYVTNRSDARLLATSAFRQKLADSIARGILDYQRTLVGQPLPATTTPTRVALPAAGVPSEASGRAVNARTVALGWIASQTALAYHVYRDGALIGSISNAPLGIGRLAFTDVWAAPGQSYRYEIASVVSLQEVALESAPAKLTVRTPPIVVALDPGHGGRDPGAGGTY